MDPRTGMDDMEKREMFLRPALELRPLDRPARSQSLYRLRYPGSCGGIMETKCGFQAAGMLLFYISKNP
jgi:hypothetical protein